MNKISKTYVYFSKTSHDGGLINGLLHILGQKCDG